MKKLIAVAFVMGTAYILLLRAISNFITRDVDGYLVNLQVTDADSRTADF